MFCSTLNLEIARTRAPRQQFNECPHAPHLLSLSPLSYILAMQQAEFLKLGLISFAQSLKLVEQLAFLEGSARS